MGDGDAADSYLIDVTTMPLARILTINDGVLAAALARLLADLDEPQEVIAAFDNFAAQD